MCQFIRTAWTKLKRYATKENFIHNIFYYIQRNKKNVAYPDWKIFPPLPDRFAPLDIMGAALRASLKPLDTIVL